MKSKGFTLVEILIAIALLGGISLGVMTLLKNMNQSQTSAMGNADLLDLRREVNSILSRDSDCSASFGGTTFHGNSIAATPISNLEFWTANSTGNRSLKKFYTGQKFGKINITDINLLMPDHSTGANFPNGTSQNQRASLTIKVQKQEMGSVKNVPDIKLSAMMFFNTDASGTSTITGCKLTGNTDQFDYPSSCSMTLSHKDVNEPKRSVVLNMSSPGYSGLRLTGNVNYDDTMYIKAQCTSSSDSLDRFLSTCEVGIGERDATDNNSPNLTPNRSATTQFNASENSFMFEGDVNGDDSFYFRMRCPTTSDTSLTAAEEYARKKCHICFGYSDISRPQPDTQICGQIQNSSDNKWNRFRLTGDVNDDDLLFIGFYCDGQSFPYVKDIIW